MKSAIQIQAEEEKPFGDSGFDKVKQTLKELHAKPWQDIDEIEVFDKVKMRAQPLYITEGKDLKSRKLTIDFALDQKFAKENPQLLPLFRQIGLLATANFRLLLADKRSYYAFDDPFVNNRQKIAWSSILKVAFNQFDDVDLDRDLSEYRMFVQRLLERGVLTRYFKELHETSYYHQSEAALNLDSMCNDIGMIVGPKGWPKIATEENIERVLKHSYFEAKFGREKLVRKIWAF